MSESSYARAVQELGFLEASPISDDLHIELALGILDARRLPKASAHLKRYAWHVLIQRHSSRIAAVLRIVKKALGENYAGRERDDEKNWRVFAENADGERVLAFFVEAPRVSSFEDFTRPFRLRVQRPDLVDGGQLDQLTAYSWLQLRRAFE